MSTRNIGIITLITASLTGMWGILFLYTASSAAPANTIAEQVYAIENYYELFMLNYTNAGLLTVVCIVMLAGFYAICRDDAPLWTSVAFVFIPIYGVGNLVVYLSQVFVLPGLLDRYHKPATEAMAEVMLGLILHTWPGSFTGFVNGLAYAALGIPSIIFGILLYRKAPAYHFGGLLLAASGMLSILALVGISIGSSVLSLLSPLGGFVFMLGIILLGVKFMRSSALEVRSSPIEVANLAP